MPARSLLTLVFATAIALAATAPNAAAESSAPRVIETPPLKLFGDGTAPIAPPPQAGIAITTPPLRLFGDGASAPERAPPQAITIETRPLKLIGVKP